MLPLANKWIVVTRPVHQAANITGKLEVAGANVILFPLINIESVDDLPLVRQQLARLSNYDLAVFISPNAVEYTLRELDVCVFRNIKVAAIGKKTKALLEAEGIKVDFSPDEISNSEEFLLIASLLDFVVGKKVVVLRGNGGRELIRNELIKIAQKVDYIDVYKRVFPHKNLQLLKKKFSQGELDIILVTSGNGLKNLFSFNDNNEWLNDVSLLLGSDRIKQQVYNIPDYQGDSFFSQDPSDNAVFDELLKWAKTSSNGLKEKEN